MAYEADLEKWCREQTVKAGGYLLKWVSPGNKGVPDRILLMPHFVAFIEFKAPKGVMAPLQGVWEKRIKYKLGLPHYVVRAKEEFLSVMTHASGAKHNHEAR